MRRLTLLVSLGLAVALFVPGCEQRKPQTRDKPGGEQSVRRPDVRKVRQDRGGKVGVPECDNYLDRYAACVEHKAPASARPAMEKNLAATRDAWRRAATTDGAREQLEKACKMARAAATRAMGAFGCKW